MSTLCLSVLMPAASSQKLRQAKPTNLVHACEKILGVPKENVELFAITPLTEEHLSASSQGQPLEVAVRINNSDLSLHNVETVIGERDKF